MLKRFQFLQNEIWKGNKRDWWDKKTKQNFHNLTECIEEYYWNRTWVIQEENISLNGTRVLNENIADFGGGWLSYETYGKKNFGDTINSI